MITQTTNEPSTLRRLPQLKAQRGRILEIGRLHGAISMGLFGSVIRGEDGPDSDVDFLVEMEPGRTLFDLGELQADLTQVLGCAVDVITPNGLRHRLRNDVLREVRPL